MQQAKNELDLKDDSSHLGWRNANKWRHEKCWKTNRRNEEEEEEKMKLHTLISVYVMQIVRFV